MPEENVPTPADSQVPLVEGVDPSWNDYLRYVPEAERPNVAPLIKQYEESTNKKVEDVRSEIEPWKPILESGMDPDTTEYAIQVLQKMQENPREIFDALGNHFKWFESGDSTKKEQEDLQGQVQSGDADLENNPAFQELAKQNKMIAQALIAQRDERVAEQQDAQLDQELKAAKEQYGDFDEEYVLMRIAHKDESVEKAVQHYNEKFGSKEPRKAAPRLHPGSGGGAVPQPKIDPKKMTDREARDHMVSILTNAKQEA